MTEKTLGIICAIKRSGKVWNQAVAEFMANYSGSPIEEYTESVLNKILKEAFVDYISTCDRPDREVFDLLDMMDHNGCYSIGHHLANLLGMVQVTDGNGHYVNGFKYF